MFKSILLALSLTALAMPPALAQFEGADNGKDQGNYTYRSKIDYVPERPRGDTGAGEGWQDVGSSGQTKHNGMRDGIDPNGPDTKFGYGARSEDAGNPLARGGSGAAQGGPLMILGQNTFFAPSNLALQTQNHSMIGGKLPKTNMDSFVHQAGKYYNANMIYGDEGTYGPPPYKFFTPDHFIERGIGGENKKGLTTGHPSDAPSAWDLPMKYNQPGGVIYGDNSTW